MEMGRETEIRRKMEMCSEIWIWRARWRQRWSWVRR
jgi:hypothetical protein